MLVGGLTIQDRAGPIPTVVQGASTELNTRRGADRPQLTQKEVLIAIVLASNAKN